MIFINKTTDSFRFEYEILHPQYTFYNRDEVALVGLIQPRNTSYPTVRMNDLDYNLVLASVGGFVGILVDQTGLDNRKLYFSTTLVNWNNELANIKATDYIRPTQYVYDPPTDYHYYYGQTYIWTCETRTWGDGRGGVQNVHNIMLKDAIDVADRPF